MSNEDGTCWIVFNGEIYNHRDAAAACSKPRATASARVSDTETILHAYEEFGPACVERLEGMFAFAIYDGRRRELFAARDRLGKKPFFYTVLDGVLHFASELPALARVAAAGRATSTSRALEGYLSLGYFLAPATIYRDVYKLMPGPLAARRRTAASRRASTGTSASSTPTTRPTDELLDDIDATLRAAVHDRLESEVPLGAFLSGGIDSGLVVSYMAEALGDRLVTTSVGFGERGAQRARGRGADGARTSRAGTTRRSIEPRLDEVIGPVTDGSRRAAGRFVGDPDLVRLAGGAAARHGGAQRRRRRRERSPATTSATCRTPSRPRRGDGCRAALAPAAGWLGARWPRVAAAAAAAACRHAAREPRARSGRRRITPTSRS